MIMKKSYVPIACGAKIYNVLESDIRKVYFMKRKKTPIIPRRMDNFTFKMTLKDNDER